MMRKEFKVDLMLSITSLLLISACGGVDAPRSGSDIASAISGTAASIIGAATEISGAPKSISTNPVAADSITPSSLANPSVSTTTQGAANNTPITITAALNTGVTTDVPVSPSLPSVTNPIVFVTQVPGMGDFAARASTFGSHLSGVDRAPRGGDLMIRYPDGSLRNLTKEAGYGVEGLQSGPNAIAVREPAVHWDAQKVVFSMIVGGPSRQFDRADSYRWQIYEVTGIGKGEVASIRKIPGQPSIYNNISPIYGSDDRIIFTSDRPRGGEAHLYPQLDEYESTPTVTGIWSLSTNTAELKILSHSPSGAFSPTIDSFGRVIYSRWDHLQRDQQADAEKAGTRFFGTKTYLNESLNATSSTMGEEVFPEARAQSNSVYGPVMGHNFNFFTPWQINQDGTDEVTVNHLGRHEFTGFIPKSFISDPALSDQSKTGLTINKLFLVGNAGILQIREDPTSPGRFYAIYGREFGQLGSNQIIRFNGAPTTNPLQFAFQAITPAEDFSTFKTPGGRFRNPLPLSNGTLIASHTPTEEAVPANIKSMRLREVTGAAPGRFLNSEIKKSVSWYNPDSLVSFDGPLWEIEAVEVVAKNRPIARGAPALENPESAIFQEEQVSQTELQNWLKKNNLALIITRDQTSRDEADLSQPFNLQVTGGKKTVSSSIAGRVYPISSFQIFEASLIRGYNSPGRRPIAQPIKSLGTVNTPNVNGPVSSVKISSDGSTAAFVPAQRALVWQTTDDNGNPIVRERVWVTFQPGEVRTCAGCHGQNDKNQAGAPIPQTKPEALRDLLRLWKTLPK